MSNESTTLRFVSLPRAAQELNVSPSTLRRRVESAGFMLDGIMETGPRIEVPLILRARLPQLRSIIEMGIQ